MQIEDAQRTTADAIAALGEAGADPARTGDFLATVARALKQRAYADARVWRPLVERGLALTAEHRDHAWARLMFLLNPIEPISRETIRAGIWIGYDPEAVAIARANGDEDDFARSFESWDPRDRSQTDELVSRARGWQRPSAIMYALTVAANDYQYRHGAFRDAAALWHELIELSERTGAIWWQQQAISQLTGLHLAAGRFDDARATDASAAAIGARLGPGLTHDLLTTMLAAYFAIYLGGDWPPIAEFLTRAIDDPVLGPHDIGTLGGAFLGAIAAYAHAEAGAADQARRLLDTLTPIAERMDPRTASQNDNGTVAFAAGAVWRLGATDLAAAYRRLAIELLTAGIGDDPLGSTELSIARMAALMGNAGEAVEYFARARQTLDAGERRPLRAIVDLDEAQFLLDAGPAHLPRVAELLDQATAAFEQLEMTPWLQRAQTIRAEADSRAGRAPLPGGLTEREVDVLRLVARGQSDREISDALYISPRTVNAHMRNMLNKTGSANRTELSIWAFEQGLVTRDEQSRPVAPR